MSPQAVLLSTHSGKAWDAYYLHNWRLGRGTVAKSCLQHKRRAEGLAAGTEWVRAAAEDGQRGDLEGFHIAVVTADCGPFLLRESLCVLAYAEGGCANRRQLLGSCAAAAGVGPRKPLELKPKPARASHGLHTPAQQSIPLAFTTNT